MDQSTAAGNVYDDPARAEAYAALEFPGTYYLAYRDLPAIMSAHVRGRTALDFGCGAGRSTRFLQGLGFETVGIDISARMIAQATSIDPAGSYLLVPDGDFSALDGAAFDLVLSAFAFDNIAGVEQRTALLHGLARLLAPAGRIVLLGSRPEIYTREWASFTTRDFPQNRGARSGEAVQIVMKDVADARPVVDYLWFHEDYLALFAAAGVELIGCHRPLARADEPYRWVSETSVAPWVIYVLAASP
jgi:SAM-dependent methyltransferase